LKRKTPSAKEHGKRYVSKRGTGGQTKEQGRHWVGSLFISQSTECREVNLKAGHEEREDLEEGRDERKREEEGPRTTSGLYHFTRRTELQRKDPLSECMSIQFPEKLPRHVVMERREDRKIGDVRINTRQDT